MRRGNNDLYLQMPKYGTETAVLQGGMKTPSIASTASYTRRPQLARTLSTTSLVSSDGDGAMESDWTEEQETMLLQIYDKELGTYSHNNPPFVASAPPPALLGKVGRKAIRGSRGWPHSLAQTRKHLLLLVRRNAPQPSTPHVAPERPVINTMSAITHDLPGYFSSPRGRRSNETLFSPFDERTFNFDKPISPAKSQTSPRQARRHPRPDLLKEGSFGFGVPLTPSRKSTRISTDRSQSPSMRESQDPSCKKKDQTSSPTRRKPGDEGRTGLPAGVAGLMRSPRRSNRIRDTGVKRTYSSLSLPD